MLYSDKTCMFHSLPLERVGEIAKNIECEDSLAPPAAAPLVAPPFPDTREGRMDVTPKRKRTIEFDVPLD